MADSRFPHNGFNPQDPGTPLSFAGSSGNTPPPAEEEGGLDFFVGGMPPEEASPPHITQNLASAPPNPLKRVGRAVRNAINAIPRPTWPRRSAPTSNGNEFELNPIFTQPQLGPLSPPVNEPPYVSFTHSQDDLPPADDGIIRTSQSSTTQSSTTQSSTPSPLGPNADNEPTGPTTPSELSIAETVRVEHSNTIDRSPLQKWVSYLDHILHGEDEHNNNGLGALFNLIERESFQKQFHELKNHYASQIALLKREIEKEQEEINRLVRQQALSDTETVLTRFISNQQLLQDIESKEKQVEELFTTRKNKINFLSHSDKFYIENDRDEDAHKNKVNNILQKYLNNESATVAASLTTSNAWIDLTHKHTTVIADIGTSESPIIYQMNIEGNATGKGCHIEVMLRQVPPQYYADRVCARLSQTDTSFSSYPKEKFLADFGLLTPDEDAANLDTNVLSHRLQAFWEKLPKQATEKTIYTFLKEQYALAHQDNKPHSNLRSAATAPSLTKRQLKELAAQFYFQFSTLVYFQSSGDDAESKDYTKLLKGRKQAPNTDILQLAYQTFIPMANARQGDNQAPMPIGGDCAPLVEAAKYVLAAVDRIEERQHGKPSNKCAYVCPGFPAPLDPCVLDYVERFIINTYYPSLKKENVDVKARVFPALSEESLKGKGLAGEVISHLTRARQRERDRHDRHCKAVREVNHERYAAIVPPSMEARNNDIHEAMLADNEASNEGNQVREREGDDLYEMSDNNPWNNMDVSSNYIARENGNNANEEDRTAIQAYETAQVEKWTRLLDGSSTAAQEINQRISPFITEESPDLIGAITKLEQIKKEEEQKRPGKLLSWRKNPKLELCKKMLAVVPEPMQTYFRQHTATSANTDSMAPIPPPAP